MGGGSRSCVTGVFNARQIEEWQTQNKSEKALIKSDIRRNAQILYTVESLGGENVVGVGMAFGYVWS